MADRGGRRAARRSTRPAGGAAGRGRDRGVSAVVGKTLEIGLLTLFVAGVTASLYGGVVPSARTTAGDAVAERAVAAAAQRVQQAVPPNATALSARVGVALPRTIRGAAYEVRARNRTLVLAHPHPGVGARARLALPPSVVSVDGAWRSTEPAVVVVRAEGDGLAVRLEEGRA